MSQPREPIDQKDMEKLFKVYFEPAMKEEPVNTEVLLHKVFFDIIYLYWPAEEKRGYGHLIRSLLTFRLDLMEKNLFLLHSMRRREKNQGDSSSSKSKSLHNNRHHVSSQNSKLCPVDSFKKYSCLLKS